MKLLVTGAAGMLGRDVVRYTRAAEHEAVALARADLDVTGSPPSPGVMRNNNSPLDAALPEGEMFQAPDSGGLLAANAAAQNRVEAVSRTATFMLRLTFRFRQARPGGFRGARTC